MEKVVIILKVIVPSLPLWFYSIYQYYKTKKEDETVKSKKS